jgi:transposase
LLSLSVRDGLNSEKIAGLYGVSRATAKRMLVRARGLLLTETKRELRGRLELTSSEFHSVARAVCDDMDISVVRLLQSEA